MELPCCGALTVVLVVQKLDNIKPSFYFHWALIFGIRLQNGSENSEACITRKRHIACDSNYVSCFSLLVFACLNIDLSPL